MARTILYYPTFSPPSSAWLKNAVLYWDKVSTIVPFEQWQELNEPDLQYLQGEGVYEPIDPLRLSSDFARSKAARLQVREAMARMEEMFRQGLNSPRIVNALTACSRSDVLMIAVQKLSRGALTEIDARQLCEGESYGPFIPVLRPAAELYMCLLAKYVAEQAQDDYIQPSTDRTAWEELAFGRGSDRAMFALLQDALPVVVDDVPYEDILRFRTRRKDELFRFRKIIDSLQDKLDKVESNSDMRRVQEQFKEEIEVALGDLHRLMDEAKLKKKFGFLKALFRPKPPEAIAAAALGAASGTYALGAPGALAGAAWGFLAGGVLSFAEEMISAQQAATQISCKPLSYVVSAQSEGILQ